MNAKWNRPTLGLLGGLAVMMAGGVASAAHQVMDDRTADSSESVELVAVVGSSDLFPGFAGGDINVSIVNSSDTPVHFTSALAGKVVSADPVKCPASFVTVKPTMLLDVVATPQSTTSTTLVDVVSMRESAPDGCQGVSFTVDLTVQATQPHTEGA